MESGTTPIALMCSGVLFPTHAASSQWVLGSCCLLRLYLVRPPDPHSRGNPKPCNCLNNSHRVACILKRDLCLSQDLFQEIRFLLQEVANIFCPLGSIALPTGQTKVRNPIGAAVRARVDVFYL